MGSGFVRSGFAAGIPWRPKSGNCGIWLVNISSTVLGWRSWWEVVGEVPALRSVARISVSKSNGWLEEISGFGRLAAVLNRLRKATCSSAVIHLCDLLAIHHQWPSLKVVTLVYLSIGGLLMHVSEVVLHALRGEHADVLDADGLEDVLFEIIVERHARYAFYDCTRPVDPHAVLPLCTRLEYDRLA